MGKVFNIQRFSLHDGPGIRTTFFLMGCSMHCRWCHNPEGISGEIQLQYFDKNCIGCGACVQVCTENVHRIEENRHMVDFSKCLLCGNCIGVCPSKALQHSGKEYTPELLAEEGIRDNIFYKNNGGVTFSGGEPLLQADFVAETARICKEQGVPSVAIDTAGNVSWECFEKVLPYTDYFLFDIKAASEDVHILGTGCSNRIILENLRRLDDTGKKIYIRIPVIPGINDSVNEIHAVTEIAGGLKHAAEIRLIPYHTFGIEKYPTLGYSEHESFSVPDDEKMDDFRNMIHRKKKIEKRKGE